MAPGTSIVTGVRPAIAWLTRERLRLRGLPRLAHLGARALVLVLLATGAIIVMAVALGDAMPGGTMAVPQGAWPRLAFVVFLAGLAVVAGTAAAATTLPGARLRALTLLGIAAATASVGARLLQLPPGVGPGSRVLGGACLAGSVALLAAGALGRNRHPLALAATAAIAPVSWLAAEAWALLAGEPSLEAALAGVTRDYLGLLGLAAGVLVLWGTFALLRTARAAGAAAGRDRRILLPTLGGVLTLKLAWIGIGLTDRVPAELPLAQVEWRRTVADGLPAWIVAMAFLAIAGGIVVQARRRTDERGVRAGFWLLVGAFTLPTVLAAAFVLAAPVGVVGGAAWVDGVRTTADLASGLILPVELGVILALPPLALLSWRLHHRSVATTLAIAALWLMPLGLATAWSVAEPSASSTPLHLFVPSQLAVDTLLTCAVAALGLDAWRSRRWRIDPRLLLTTLLVGGVAANTGLLVPVPWALPVGGLLLVYPVAWTLLVDAGAANLPGPARPARVLAILGGAALLLLLAMLPFSAGAEPDAGMTSIARVLMAVPMATALVLAWWGRKQRLPHLDRSVPTAERSLPILDRVDAFGPGWRTVAGTTLVAIAIVVAGAYARGRERPDPPGPTAAPEATPMYVALIPPGEIVFGTALDASNGTLIDPGHRVPVGTKLTWFAHLSRPTSGSGLELELEQNGVLLGSVAVDLEAGSAWTSGVEVLDLLTDSVWRLRYREAGAVLAEGLLAVGDASTDP